MALESVTYLPELTQTNPVGATDPKSQGDDHLRNIKKALLNTFGAFVGTAGAPKSVTLTEDQINDASRKAADETIAGDKTHTGFIRTDDSTTSRAGFRIPTGVAPTSPVQGDIWATASDILAYINGVAESLIGGGGQVFCWLPPDGTRTLTNQSTALQYFAINNGYRTKLDLSGFTQTRLISHVSTGGFAGSYHEVRYATTFAAAASSYLTLGSSAVRITHDTSTAMEDTGWIDLVSGAKIDNAFLALVMDDGNDTADPVIEQVQLYFK